MSEYASRGRSHDVGYASTRASPTHVPAPPPRTPAEQAQDAVASLERSVASLAHALATVRDAREGNAPQRWSEARGILDRQLATTTQEHERARTLAADASPTASAALTQAATALAAHEREAAALIEPPTGFRAVATEDAIVAILTAPAEGDAHARFAHKEAALRDHVDALAPADRRELSRRLRVRRPNDPLAVAFSTRLNVERQQRLLAHLAGASQREAVAAARGPQIANPHRAADAPPIADPGPEPLDVRLRRALDADGETSLVPQITDVIAPLDGTTRRELARRLENYRPGSGDDIAARFVRLDRSVRLEILAALTSSLVPAVTTAAPQPALPMTASVYARTHLAAIVAAVEHHLTASGLPHPHARLRWSSQKQAIEALVAELGAHLAADPGRGATRLYELAYPADLWPLIDVRRGAAPADPTHPRTAADDIFHGPVGPRTWKPEVGIAIAAALDHVIVPSLQRMGMRLRVQLDNPVRVVYGGTPGADSELTTADLVTSTPLDRLIANVLAAPELVHATQDKTKGNTKDTHAPERDTPGRPFADGLKRVDYTWQGEHDPKAWNWIRVSWPERATAEDVAFTFYTDFSDPAATPRSDQAYQITAAPPYFALPIATARELPDAWKHAPAELKDPFSVARPTGEHALGLLDLAARPFADEIALAQAPASENAAPTAPRSFEHVAIQLDYLRDRLAPWKLDAPLEGAIAFLARRRIEEQTPPHDVARWAGVAVAQKAALLAISSDLAQIFSELSSHGVAAADGGGLQPVVELLTAYARAAGVSHLAQQAPAALASARRLRALLPLALAEDRVRQTRSTVAEQQATQRDTGFVDDGARAPIASLPLLAERAAQLRAKADRGETVEPDAVERLTVDADEMTLRSRLVTLSTQVRTLEQRARAEGLPDDKIGMDGFWTVQGVVDLLRRKVRDWTAVLDHGTQWHGPTADRSAAQTATHQLRHAITQVEHAMISFDEKLGLAGFFNHAYAQIADDQMRDAILRIAAEIGVFVVTGQFATAGVAALRGVMLARRAMLAGKLVAHGRGAGMAFAGLELAAHAGMATATQGLLGGDAGPRAFAENALGIAFSNIAMRPFARLFKDTAKIEAELRGFAPLAKRAGKAAARGAVTLGGEVGSAAAAHYITHFDQLELTSSQEWITQGFALLAGKFVHQRSARMHERIEHAAQTTGTRVFEGLHRKNKEVGQRALAATTDTSSAETMKLLEDSHQVMVEVKALDTQLDHASNADATHDLTALGPEFIEVPLRLAGLRPVVDGEVYTGSAREIDDALASAKRMGLDVTSTVDPATGIRKVVVGSKEIRIHEEGTAAARPRRTVDDFLGTPATASELATAKNQAKREDSRSLDEHAGLVQSGKSRTEREMLLAVKNGEMPRYLARVGPAGYPTFASPTKAFVFATEPADLRGLSVAEAMVKVGWTRDWIEGNINKVIEVTILDTQVAVPDPATGMANRVEIGRMEWKDIKRAALADPVFLERAKVEGFSEPELTDLFDVMIASWSPRAGNDAPQHPPRTLSFLRMLDKAYSVNELFTGIGSTMEENGQLGGREVMVQGNRTSLALTPQNHRKVSLGVLTRRDFDALFQGRSTVAGGDQ